jgi:glycosyltransferase involved in cell wall biosynthesis
LRPNLTIAVPTYNRPDNLANLATNFIYQVAELHPEKIEIIISDNSDVNHLEKNKSLAIYDNIHYSHNEKNIGFAANVLKCIDQAKGEYIWIISDDDDVDVMVFTSLLESINSFKAANITAVLLPFKHGLATIGGRSPSSSPGKLKIEKFWDVLVSLDDIPFILFSSVIIRNRAITNKRRILDSLIKNFSENVFIQIPTFARFIDKDSHVLFWRDPLQEYLPPKKVRFSIKEMTESLDSAVSFLCLHDNALRYRFSQVEYKRWMGWIYQVRIGAIDIDGGIPSRLYITFKWLRFHFRSLLHVKFFLKAIAPYWLLKSINKEI